MSPRLMLTPEEIRTKIRRPLSLPMLVYYGHEWQVCHKAKGKMPGDRIAMAWSMARNASSLCEVVQEKYLFDLPNPYEKPFSITPLITASMRSMRMEARSKAGRRAERCRSERHIPSV